MSIINQVIQHNQEYWEQLVFILSNRKTPVLVWISCEDKYIEKDMCEKIKQQFPHSYDMEILKEEIITSLYQTINSHSKAFPLLDASHIVHIFGIENHFNKWGSAKLFAQINFERELLYQKIPHSTIIWSTINLQKKIAQEAPDFWNWMNYFFTFYSTHKIKSLKFSIKITTLYTTNVKKYYNDLSYHFKEIEKNSPFNLNIQDIEEIKIGQAVGLTIKQVLEQVDILIILLSQDFIQSDYLYEEWLQKALKYQQNESLKIIPILIQNCNWQYTPLRDLKIFPEDKQAIATARFPESIYRDIMDGLTAVIEAVSKKKEVMTIEAQAKLQTKPTTPLSNPFTHRKMIKNPDHFIGRTLQINDILTRIKGGNSVSVMGERRIGKSSLLYQLYKTANRRLTDPKQVTFVLVFMDLLSPSIKSPTTFVQKLAKGLDLAMDETAIAQHPMLFLEEALENYPKKAILLLDEFEEIAKRKALFNDDFIDALRSLGNSGLLTFIIASKSSLKSITERGGLTSPFYNIFSQMPLKGFDYLPYTHNPVDESQDFIQYLWEPLQPTSQEKQWLLAFRTTHPLAMQVFSYWLFQNRQLNYPLAKLLGEIEQELNGYFMAKQAIIKKWLAQGQERIQNNNFKLSSPFSFD